MPYELIKEKMTLSDTIANDTMQLLIEGDIIVPDVKPDMAVVLKTEAEACIDRAELSSDRLNFTGKLYVKILYLAKGQGKTVHSMSAVHNIDDFMNLEGVDRDMWVSVNANIANIDYKMLNDRKIGYKSVIDLNVCVEGRTEHEIISTIDGIPDGQLRKKTLSVNKTIDNKTDRFVIKEEIVLPPGKPNIRELLQTSVTIANKDIKLASGRAGISGDLVIYSLYKSDDEESLIEFIEAELPFNGSIELPTAGDGQIGDLSLITDGQYIQIRPNSDGEDRILEVEISMLAAVKLSAQTELEVLDDAYIVNKNVNLRRETIRYPKLVCRNKNQCPVKEVVEIGADCPDMLQIYKISGRVQVDSTKIIEDKVIVEGIIETDVLYIAKSDDTPLYNYSTVLPYRQVIETRGASPDMEAVIEKNIDHTGYNLLSERELELRFLISFNTKVTSSELETLVVDAEVTDMDEDMLDKMPSIIIYVVQKGDSLWSIAKRYNTSIDELVELNDIENRDLIIPGQKLLILKKIGE